jgi:hypothetical protein
MTGHCDSIGTANDFKVEWRKVEGASKLPFANKPDFDSKFCQSHMPGCNFRQRNAFRYGFEFVDSEWLHLVIRRTCRDLAMEQSLLPPDLQ